MRISSHYTQIINRLLGSEKPKTEDRAQSKPADSEDRQELSRILTLVQRELKRIEGEPSPDHTARLQKLAAEIARGEYRVDDDALAEAMLEYFKE